MGHWPAGCGVGSVGAEALAQGLRVTIFSYGLITKTFSICIQLNVWALSKHTVPYSSAALNFSFSYHPGSCNIKPDACSRLYSPDSTSHNSSAGRYTGSHRIPVYIFVMIWIFNIATYRCIWLNWQLCLYSWLTHTCSEDYVLSCWQTNQPKSIHKNYLYRK